MSYNIFLSGGGSATETYELDDVFLKTSGDRILYLPIGLKRSTAGYDDCVTWFTNMVNSHNILKNISAWIDVSNKTSKIDRKKFDGIYIGGASETFSLHNLFIKHDMYPKLISFVQQGGLIYGGSGGASILGKSINYDQIEKSQPRVEENSANLCMGYSVFAHLNDKNISIIEALSNGNVIGIPEGGGCMIDGQKKVITYIGTSRALILTNFSSRYLENKESTNII